MEEESYREKPVVLELKNIKKTFGDVAVLKGINLSVKRENFSPFWGPQAAARPQRSVSLQALKLRMKERCSWREET